MRVAEIPHLFPCKGRVAELLQQELAAEYQGGVCFRDGLIQPKNDPAKFLDQKLA